MMNRLLRFLATCNRNANRLFEALILIRANLAQAAVRFLELCICAKACHEGAARHVWGLLGGIRLSAQYVQIVGIGVVLKH